MLALSTVPVSRSLELSKPHCASLPYFVPGGGASPSGNGLELRQLGCVGEGPRQANWWAKLSLVKNICDVFANDGPAYWKLVATFMPKKMPPPPRNTVFVESW